MINSGLHLIQIKYILLKNRILTNEFKNMKTRIINNSYFLRNILIVLGFIVAHNALKAQTIQTISFKSSDSLKVTADLYIKHAKDAPFIIFFHQAGWSRGEYLEIAPKINKMGFNAMAVDQRSGGKVNGIINQTNKEAKKYGKATMYLDALPDMEAAINYVSANYPDAKLILWGSSYSSALVLKLAGDHPNKVKGVLAFSPAEYYGRFGKPDDYIAQSARNINCPAFISSAKDEAQRWQPIFDVIPSTNKNSFIPKATGNHGSRALWESKSAHNEYWIAVKTFLKNNF